MNWIYSPRKTLCCPLLDSGFQQVGSLCLVPTLIQDLVAKKKKIHHHPQKEPHEAPWQGCWLLLQLDTKVIWIPVCCLCFADLASSLVEHIWMDWRYKGGGEFPGIQGAFPALLGQSMILHLRDEMIEFFFFRASFCPRFWGLQGCLHPPPPPQRGHTCRCGLQPGHTQLWWVHSEHSSPWKLEHSRHGTHLSPHREPSPSMKENNVTTIPKDMVTSLPL